MAQEERRKIEWVKVVVELTILIITNIVIVVGAYYKLDTRMVLAEQQIQQETTGYATLLSGFNTRMDKFELKFDKMETKLECVGNSKFCH